ncbi:MAG: oligosaccharide flippase family protein [Pseudomonadota bacterium]
MSLLRGALHLGSLELICTLLRFARTVLLARALGVEEFGVANTVLILVALADAFSNLGLAQFVIRDREGDSPRVTATVQTMVLVRGLATAALIWIFAAPIAAMLGQPELVDMYRLVGIVAAVPALLHIEVARVQRAMNFRLMAQVECLGLAVSVLAVAPILLVVADARAMVVFLLAERALKVIASLWLHDVPFRLGWDRAAAWRAWRFGWPILLAAPVSFLTLQGDRLVVANRFDAADLGQLSAALTLAVTPTMMLARVLGPLFLSALSRARVVASADSPAVDRAASDAALLALEAHMVVAAGSVVAVAIGGPAAVLLIFGPSFGPGAELIGLAGLLAAIPVIRGAFVTVSVSDGRTIEPLIANLPRLLAVPLALLAAIEGAGLVAVLLIGLAGEAAGVCVALGFFARRYRGVGVLRRLAPGLALTAVVLLAVLALQAIGQAALFGLPLPPLWAAVGLVALLGALLWQCRALRAQAAARLGRGRD